MRFRLEPCIENGLTFCCGFDIGLREWNVPNFRIFEKNKVMFVVGAVENGSAPSSVIKDTSTLLE